MVNLRPVSDEERAPRETRRDRLGKMRDRLEKTFYAADCPPRDLAALARRLQEIDKEIDQIDMAGDGEDSVVANTDDEPFDATSV